MTSKRGLNWKKNTKSTMKEHCEFGGIKAHEHDEKKLKKDDS